MNQSEPLPPALALITCVIASNDPEINRRILNEIETALLGDYTPLEPFSQLWGDILSFEGDLGIPALFARHPEHSEILQCCNRGQDLIHPAAWREYLEAQRKVRLNEGANLQLKFIKDTLSTNGDVLAAFEKATAAVARLNEPTKRRRNNAELLSIVLNDLNQRKERADTGKRSGILTGIADLDRILDGLQSGQLTVFGARPSVGKTTFGITLMNRIALVDGIPALFISLEGTIPALLMRFIGCHTGASVEDLRRGYTDRWENEISEFVRRFSESPLRIINHTDDPSIFEIERIVAEIKTGIRVDGVRVVVVDYLQKIKATETHEAHRLAVGEVSSRLAQVAQSTGIHIIALAQLKRDAEGANPTLADLAESAHIERDADNILLLDRGDRTSEECRIIVAKQRDGALGAFNARFDLTRQAIRGLGPQLD